MPFHCFDRTCHLGPAKAAILTFQQDICDAGRGMQTNSEGMRYKKSSVALYMCLSTRRVRGIGREETGTGGAGTGRYTVSVWIEGTGQRAASRSLTGSSFKWPSSENPSYSTWDTTTSHCSNQAHPVKYLRVGDTGGEFWSNTQKSLFTALSPSATTGADQASCNPSKTPLAVTGPFITDALSCFILGYTYCLLAAVRFSVSHLLF